MRTPYRKPGIFSQTTPDPLLTAAKFAELEQKLARLKSARPAAAAEVARLAELGDFSENAEYQLAKGRLRSLNNNMLKLERQLGSAVIIAPPKQTGRVHIGSTVTVAFDGKHRTYHILGSAETNPHKGIISHNSPLGAALLGRRVGETVSIKHVGGETTYTIMTIAS